MKIKPSIVILASNYLSRGVMDENSLKSNNATSFCIDAFTHKEVLF